MLARSRDWLMAFIWYHNDQLIEFYNLCGFGAFFVEKRVSNGHFRVRASFPC